MARDINWDEPLTDEDRVWAEQRLDTPSGRDGLTIGEQIAKNDEVHGKAEKDQAKSRAERISELRSTIADSQNELSRLQQEEIDENNANVARAGSSGDQAAGLGFTDNTPVNGQAPDGAPTATDTYDDTAKWTVAALKSEIERRNDDGADLKVSGTRSELVERLRADDRVLAEQAE